MCVYGEYFCFCVQVVCVCFYSVHHVIVRSAKFCTVCSLFMFVFDMM